MIKIDIVSGFLGAGKTVFIKRLLEEAIPGEQVALIKNEFGEIGIDGGSLKDLGIEIREMNSGCICCSLVGDFSTSLVEVLTRYKLKRTIIEPPGMDRLSDVIKAVIDASADMGVELNSAVTIVGATKCKMYMKNLGEFFNSQIGNAGTIVLSHTGITDTSKIQKDVGTIREKNTNAVVITTPLDQSDGSRLLEIIEKKDIMLDDLLAEIWESHYIHDRGGGSLGHHHHDHDGECCGHHDHGEEYHNYHRSEECHDHYHGEKCHSHHRDGCGYGCDRHHYHADEVFTNWGMEIIVSVTYEQLGDILERLPSAGELGDVSRTKGILPTENPGGRLYFDLVPEQYEIHQGKPDYTGKVCMIDVSLREEGLNSIFGGG